LNGKFFGGGTRGLGLESGQIEAVGRTFCLMFRFKTPISQVQRELPHEDIPEPGASRPDRLKSLLAKDCILVYILTIYKEP